MLYMNIRSNKDNHKLPSLSNDLQRSKALGMCRICGGCEGIKIMSTRMDEEARAADDEKYAGGFHIYGILIGLEVSVASACAALDEFYAAR